MVNYPIESAFWAIHRTGRTSCARPNLSNALGYTKEPPAWFPHGLVPWPAVQVRFPRSKKRRVAKKWAKRPSSWRVDRPLFVPAAEGEGTLLVEGSYDGLCFTVSRVLGQGR
jgi:hypothetical protein